MRVSGVAGDDEPHLVSQPVEVLRDLHDMPHGSQGTGGAGKIRTAKVEDFHGLSYNAAIHFGYLLPKTIPANEVTAEMTERLGGCLSLCPH